MHHGGSENAETICRRLVKEKSFALSGILGERLFVAMGQEVIKKPVQCALIQLISTFDNIFGIEKTAGNSLNSRKTSERSDGIYVCLIPEEAYDYVSKVEFRTSTVTDLCPKQVFQSSPFDVEEWRMREETGK